MSDNEASLSAADQLASLYCPAVDNEAVEATAADVAHEEAQEGDSEPSGAESLGSCDSSSVGEIEVNNDEEDYVPDGMSSSSSSNEQDPLKRSRSATPMLPDDDDDDDVVEEPHLVAAAVQAPSKKVRRPKTYG